MDRVRGRGMHRDWRHFHHVPVNNRLYFDHIDGDHHDHRGLLDEFDDDNSLEPITAVGDPPGDEKDGKGSSYAPPDGQQEIRRQAQHYKNHPKDFPFHSVIVGRRWRKGAMLPTKHFRHFLPVL